MNQTFPMANPAQVIDLAGRQRMLNQRLMKEVLAGLLEQECDWRLTMRMLRETGNALIFGGQSGPMMLPPAPTTEIQAQMALQGALLDVLESSATKLLSKETDDLSSFLNAGARVHEAADKGTQMLASHCQLEKDAAEAREREADRTIREILAIVDVQSEELAGSSQKLSAVSLEMQGDAKEASNQAALVSGASEEIAHIVQTVAAATEELNASIKEIAMNASGSARTVASAVKIAEETNEAVAHLGQSGKAIRQVVNVISTVARQTNLLALNAAIEAARAGDAGRGFAVVAHEVKELARQTAQATEDIGQKIEAIQDDTDSAVRAIEQIHSIIGQLSMASTTIASAAEEQTAATAEISRNLREAATGSSKITTGIAGVASVALRTSAGAEESLLAANGLAGMASKLRKIVAGVGSK
jgi:methyl-accepting chemotaxis protein